MTAVNNNFANSRLRSVTPIKSGKQSVEEGNGLFASTKGKGSAGSQGSHSTSALGNRAKGNEDKMQKMQKIINKYTHVLAAYAQLRDCYTLINSFENEAVYLQKQQSSNQFTTALQPLTNAAKQQEIQLKVAKLSTLQSKLNLCLDSFKQVKETIAGSEFKNLAKLDSTIQEEAATLDQIIAGTAAHAKDLENFLDKVNQELLAVIGTATIVQF